MAIFTFTNRERSAGEKDSPLGRITGQMCSNLSNSNPCHRPFTLESFFPAFLTRLPTPSASGRLHPPLPLVPSRYTLSGTDVSILLCFLPWNGKGIHFVLCAVCASLSLPQRTATDRGLQWRTDRIITTALRTEWTGEGRAAEPTGAALQRDSTAPCAPTAAHGAPQGNGRARARPASLRRRRRGPPQPLSKGGAARPLADPTPTASLSRPTPALAPPPPPPSSGRGRRPHPSSPASCSPPPDGTPAGPHSAPGPRRRRSGSRRAAVTPRCRWAEGGARPGSAARREEGAGAAAACRSSRPRDRESRPRP